MSKPRPTMHSVRMELFKATPLSVWREYAANGYIWAEMIDEELSYAETIGEAERGEGR